MKEEFYRVIFEKQLMMEVVPSNDVITSWAQELLYLLYPEKAEYLSKSTEEIEERFDTLETQLARIMNATGACGNADHKERSRQFFSALPGIYDILNTDIEAIYNGDPAAISKFEVIRAYPGFYAICFYRIAHALLNLDIPLLPRILTEYAHSKTGIDIHPAAQIGGYFCIDHGTGIVIGETCIIGDHVKLYQGVTLGALSVDKSLANIRRHPTVEDHVILYSGATILGGDSIIGHHSIVGGNVWLTKSIPPYSTVYHKPDIEVVEQTNL